MVLLVYGQSIQSRLNQLIVERLATSLIFSSTTSPRTNTYLDSLYTTILTTSRTGIPLDFKRIKLCDLYMFSVPFGPERQKQVTGSKTYTPSRAVKPSNPPPAILITTHLKLPFQLQQTELCDIFNISGLDYHRQREQVLGPISHTVSQVIVIDVDGTAYNVNYPEDRIRLSID